MKLDEIKQLMFTRVVGKTIGLDYKGELIGYDSSKRNPFVIRLDGSDRLVDCFDIDPIPTPKLRPYKNSSEIPLDKIMARLKTWTAGNRWPIGTMDHGVNMGGGHEYTYEKAFDKLEWADGSPFGVIE